MNLVFEVPDSEKPGTVKLIKEKLTRSKFEEINADIFRRMLVPVQQALEDAGIAKNQVDEIVLVGGSTRVPRVR